MPKTVASAQITILDSNDFAITSATAPLNPQPNQLWIDTSLTPNQMKKWNGSVWVIVNEVKIGGRNLLKNSGFPITVNDYKIMVYDAILIKPNTTYTVVVRALVASGQRIGTWLNNGATNVNFFTYVAGDNTYTTSFTTPASITAQKLSFYNYPSSSTSATIYWACLYEGAINPPMDWIASPEDDLGGRNYIVGTKAPYLSSNNWITGGWGGSMAIDIANNGLLATGTNGWKSYKMAFPALANKTVTVSFYAKYTAGNEVPFLVGTGSGGTWNIATGAAFPINSVSLAYQTRTFVLDPSGNFIITVRQTDEAGLSTTVLITNLKLELGKVATEHTVAIEDASNALAEIAADDKLTPADKQVALKEWQAVQGEYTRLSTQCTALGVTNSLSTPYVDLANYINPLLSSMTTTSTIVGATFRSWFTAYYNARTDLQNALTSKVQANLNITNGVVDETKNRLIGKNLMLNSLINETSSAYGFAGRTINLTAGKTYTMTINGSAANALNGKNLRVFLSNQNWSWVSYLQITETSTVTKSVIFTVPVTATYDFGAYYYDNSNPRTGSVTLYWVKVEEGTFATPYSEAPEDTAAAIASTNYLKQALEGVSDVNGGLMATMLLRMKDAADVINGGMSGLPDNIGFWTGGTYAQALADSIRAFKTTMATGALDRKDGAGHRAKGNFAWDVDGNVFIKGIIEAITGGKIAGFDIADQLITAIDPTNLTALKMGNLPIETLETLKTPNNTNYLAYPAATLTAVNTTSYNEGTVQSITKSLPNLTTAGLITFSVRGSYTDKYVNLNSYVWEGNYIDEEQRQSTTFNWTLNAAINAYNDAKNSYESALSESDSAEDYYNSDPTQENYDYWQAVLAVTNSLLTPFNDAKAALAPIKDTWSEYTVYNISTVKLKNSAGTVIYTKQLAGFNVNDIKIDIPQAGTYTLVCECLSYPIGTEDVLAMVGDITIGIGTAAKPNVAFANQSPTTMIGNNGMYSWFNELRYFYLNVMAGGITALGFRGALDIPAGLGGASINGSGGVFANWGKIAGTGQVVKSGSNYTITHNIGDTNYSLILTPISGNVPYISSAKSANSVVVTCAGGFDFVLIRTQ